MRHAIDRRDLCAAQLLQTRLSEATPSARHSLAAYVRMMALHQRLRLEHGQRMEASRIADNLLALCTERSLQSLSIPLLLFVARVHSELHMRAVHVLRAWALCKRYAFAGWLPDCVVALARLHVRLGNGAKARRLVLKHMPRILGAGHGMEQGLREACKVEAYVVLAESRGADDGEHAAAVRYLHLARVWCVWLMREDRAFAESCLATELLRKIYYLLARRYEHVGDARNRDRAAAKLIELLEGEKGDGHH